MVLNLLIDHFDTGDDNLSLREGTVLQFVQQLVTGVYLTYLVLVLTLNEPSGHAAASQSVI